MALTNRIGAAGIAKFDALWPAILDTVANGRNVEQFCKANGLTYSALRAYRSTRPELDREWQLAREERAEYCAERIMDITSSPMPDAAVARVNLDALRWLASKYHPKAYSDKAQLDVNVKTVDMTAIILEANKRLSQQRTIEGEVVRDALPKELL